MERADLEILPLAVLGAAQGIFKYYIRPEITARRTWALIGSIVAVHELICPPGELLSEEADRAIAKHPWIPYAGALLGAHVLNLVEEKYDLIHHVNKLRRLA